MTLDEIIFCSVMIVLHGKDEAAKTSWKVCLNTVVDGGDSREMIEEDRENRKYAET